MCTVCMTPIINNYVVGEIELCYRIFGMFEICRFFENLVIYEILGNMEVTNTSTSTSSFHNSTEMTTFVPRNFSNDSLITASNDSFCRHLLYMTISPS